LPLHQKGQEVTKTPEISIDRNVAYTVGDRPLLWDVYRPAANEGNAPVVLAIHGGGWRHGHREMMEAVCTTFAQQGFVAIAPEYRLLGEVQWPVPLNDLRTAIRATRAGAKSLGIDPEHIFLAGYSAGAHLSLLAASMKAAPPGSQDQHHEQRETVAAVAAFFPPARIEGPYSSMLGVAESELHLVSPQTYAATLPPTMIFCGDADTLTPPQLSVDLYNAIRAAGGVSDLRLLSHLVHEFVSLPGMLETTTRDAVEFFDRTVIHKAAFDEALGALNDWWKERMAQAARQAQ
jgi:acetyl esterase/lipase